MQTRRDKNTASALASEGARFTQVVTEFTDEIRALGPLQLLDWPFDRASADAQLAPE